MTNLWPLKFREVEGQTLFADDAGGFFLSNRAFLERYVSGNLTNSDDAFLREAGHAYEVDGDTGYLSFAYRWARRQSVQKELTYLILVPTLRCNLSCSYCQVSRAAENASGFDWSEDTLTQTLAFIDRIQSPEIKIEFQGGEPLLRVDLLDRVREFCRAKFQLCHFVVCTNLQSISPKAWEFLASDDTVVSTSLDGDENTHQRQRTKSDKKSAEFFANLRSAIDRLGSGKVSALPTIDLDRPPSYEKLIDAFSRFGFNSVYLRPVNYQGFARRKPQPDELLLSNWNLYHAGFIEALIDHNFRTGDRFEEYYFSQCLRRVLRLDADNHVDLRNPNFLASDYIVVDYDGRLFPTDEARMLSRIGRIDLSVGHVRDGVDQTIVSQINAVSLNNFDPDCIHCVYQPFCGTDIVDNLSRYGRVDLPRHETWFCKRQLSIFDKVFQLLYRGDEPTNHSLSLWSGTKGWPKEIVSRHS